MGGAVDPEGPLVIKQRLIIAITGATGAIYGVRLLERLRGLPSWESHLILSEAGALNLWHELRMRRKDLEALADASYSPKDMGSALASGSFLTEGMVIAPCSMKTLAAVANAYSGDLLTRAADVVLKERRRLVLMPRETPLNLAHLRNMTSAAQMGAIICPPLPAFYAQPKTIEDLVAHTIGRILDLFGVHSPKLARWHGMGSAAQRLSSN